MAKVKLAITMSAPVQAFAAVAVDMDEAKVWLLVPMVVEEVQYAVVALSSFQCSPPQRLVLLGKAMIFSDEVALLVTLEAHLETLKVTGETNLRKGKDLRRINKLPWVTSRVSKVVSSQATAIVVPSTSPSIPSARSNMEANLSLSSCPRDRWLLFNSLSTLASSSTRCR